MTAAPVECTHGSDPAVCPPCQDAGKPLSRPDVQWRAWSPPFASRYDGVCGPCGDPIHAGETVRTRQDVDGELRQTVHDLCVDAT